jgi:pimeloyl-ACP methyl ester carboxylesterase
MSVAVSPQKFVQSALRFTAAVAPEVASTLMWRLFCTPLWASQPTPSQSLKLSEARHFQVKFGRRSLDCFRWGEAHQPTILAIHGWGGRAHVFGDLLEPILKNGYSVVSFNAPGHYRLGQKTNMLEYSSAIRSVARKLDRVDGLMGHSFGAFTSAYTASKLDGVKALALIGAPDRLDFMLDYARQLMDAPHHILPRLEGRIEKISGEPVKDHATHLYLQDQDLPKLVVHDLNDREVPISRAVEMAKVLDAELFQTEGFGHHRILQSRDVADKLASFFGRHINP